MQVKEINHMFRASFFMAEAGIICILWVVLYSFNDLFFSAVKINSFVCWIFLPAALRMISVMILEWSAVIGLFVGAMLTARWSSSSEFLYCIPLAMISAGFPLLAVQVCKRGLHLTTSLEGLTSTQLGLFALMGALFNSVPSQFYLHYFLGERLSLNALIPMMIGDLAGTLAVLYTVSWILKALSRRRWQ